jgi:Fe-S oxidoreductase
MRIQELSASLKIISSEIELITLKMTSSSLHQSNSPEHIQEMRDQLSQKQKDFSSILHELIAEALQEASNAANLQLALNALISAQNANDAENRLIGERSIHQYEQLLTQNEEQMKQMEAIIKSLTKKLPAYSGKALRENSIFKIPSEATSDPSLPHPTP